MNCLKSILCIFMLVPFSSLSAVVEDSSMDTSKNELLISDDEKESQIGYNAAFSSLSGLTCLMLLLFILFFHFDKGLKKHFHNKIYKQILIMSFFFSASYFWSSFSNPEHEDKEDKRKKNCTSRGTIFYYIFISYIMWKMIWIFDLFWSYKFPKKKGDFYRFLLYILVGYGFPIFVTLIVKLTSNFLSKDAISYNIIFNTCFIGVTNSTYDPEPNFFLATVFPFNLVHLLGGISIFIYIFSKGYHTKKTYTALYLHYYLYLELSYFIFSILILWFGVLVFISKQHDYSSIKPILNGYSYVVCAQGMLFSLYYIPHIYIAKRNQKKLSEYDENIVKEKRTNAEISKFIRQHTFYLKKYLLYAIQNSQPVPSSIIDDQAFKYSIPKVLDKINKEAVKFIDYAPVVFNEIRKNENLSLEDLKEQFRPNAVTVDIEDVKKGERRFLIISKNRKYCFKSIPYFHKLTNLKENLRAFYERFKTPNCLLSPILGCFVLKYQHTFPFILNRYYNPSGINKYEIYRLNDKESFKRFLQKYPKKLQLDQQQKDALKQKLFSELDFIQNLRLAHCAIEIHIRTKIFKRIEFKDYHYLVEDSDDEDSDDDDEISLREGETILKKTPNRQYKIVQKTQKKITSYYIHKKDDIDNIEKINEAGLLNRPNSMDENDEVKVQDLEGEDSQINSFPDEENKMSSINNREHGSEKHTNETELADISKLSKFKLDKNAKTYTINFSGFFNQGHENYQVGEQKKKSTKRSGSGLPKFTDREEINFSMIKPNTHHQNQFNKRKDIELFQLILECENGGIYKRNIVFILTDYLRGLNYSESYQFPVIDFSEYDTLRKRIEQIL